MNDAYDFILWIYTHTGNFDTVIFAFFLKFSVAKIVSLWYTTQV